MIILGMRGFGPLKKLMLGFIILAILIPIMTDSVYAKEIISVPEGHPLTASEIMSESAIYKSFENYHVQIRPLYTTVDDPSNHVVPPGGSLDGIGDLITSDGLLTFRCTATLLPPGDFALTAAHCLTDEFGSFNTVSATVKFEGDSGDVTIPVSAFFVHPAFDGDLFRGNDIAVLQLASVAPAEITRHDIDRTPANDVGTITNKIGYGGSGTGDTGKTLVTGTKREGFNKYDALADVMLTAFGLVPGVDFVPGSVVQYDFDNGLAANDAFGFFFGITGLGLGTMEVSAASGDSGGPSLTSPIITGVTSYGVRVVLLDGSTSDVDGTINSSFGEFTGDTRVSQYTDFVDSIVLPSPPVGGTLIPIDTTALLLASVQSISAWMIPVVAGIGIGVFVIKRRK